MYTCASCESQFIDGTVCSSCKRNLDFQCSGITEHGYRRLGERQKSWRCPQCKTNASPSRLPSPSPSQLDNMQEQLNKIIVQLGPLSEDVKSIKSELGSLRESLDMAHDLLGKFSGTIKALETRVIKTEKIINEVPALHSEIALLKQELREKDQWARANNVEIQGIPLKKSENLYEIAEKIAKTGDLTIKKEDINYIARIPTRVPNKEKPIIISFNNRYTKENFVAASRKTKPLKLQSIGFSSNEVFYVNDHLTQYNKNLLSKARALAKEKNYKYVWVKHCKIMVRMSDTSPIIFIKSESDLLKIL